MKTKPARIKQIIVVFCFCFSINVSAQLAGLVITGVADSPAGATWTYNATIGSVVYNLEGLLYKPAGAGTFPSVIINHGTGGDTDTNGYSDKIAKEMVTWGFVSIATNYCHMGTSMDFPCGSPGLCNPSEWGASPNNFLRALKVREILTSLSYTDTSCIATFGHSRGSFLTTGLVGTYPTKFNCAGHTAGGFAIPDTATMPTLVMANNVSIPYILHHGDADVQVNIINDNNLDSVLTSNGIIHQYYVYPGFTHSMVPHNDSMYVRTRAFFNQYICSSTAGINDSQHKESNKITAFPNPFSNSTTIQFNHPIKDASLNLFNSTGSKIKKLNFSGESVKIERENLSEGMYYYQIIQENGNVLNGKLMIVD